MRYRVKKAVIHGTNNANSRRYEAGELIDLPDRDAAPLLACGAIELYRPEAIEMVFNPLFPVESEGGNCD